MSLSNLASLLLIPPLNCLVAACAGAALGRRRGGKPLLYAGLGGLVLLGMPAISRPLLLSLEQPAEALPPPGIIRPADPATPQAIVILSGDQQDFIGQGNVVGPLTLERDCAGAALARATHLPVLVTGGILAPGTRPLADQMAINLARDFATPVRWRETAAQDTWENAALSAPMLRQDGISRIYLVTHAWHMRRALLAFRHAGLTVTPAPLGIDTPTRFQPAAFIPGARGWQQSYYAFHEWIGILWYRLHA